MPDVDSKSGPALIKFPPTVMFIPAAPAFVKPPAPMLRSVAIVKFPVELVTKPAPVSVNDPEQETSPAKPIAVPALMVCPAPSVAAPPLNAPAPADCVNPAVKIMFAAVVTAVEVHTPVEL